MKANISRNTPINLFNLNLDIKADDRGRLIFYRSLRLKILNSLLFLGVVLFGVYIIKSNNLHDSWPDTWVVQALKLGVVLALILIWEDYSVAFDEMMQMVIIKKWFSSILPDKNIYHNEIKAIVLKRYAYEDEDGHITNEGFFHLELHNGNSCFLMKFTESDRIDDARKKLQSHTKLKIQMA